ncbi:hypothetical protein G5S52_00705 [Grimontia sp. S25]|uniref:Uncharacterized protein n=1 Tax=Grimontia sedimenti TaxID=2711294 RepID=A0A6M1R1R6_9GAMM|nr:hypothetical protein [Grimontia sedimenti]NGN96223.1 hypothetical protein [Grimontia sedimenti]
MKKTKRIIWVPYGYRRRSVIRKASRTSHSESDLPTRSSEETFERGQERTSSNSCEIQVKAKGTEITNTEPASSSKKENTSKVASFSPDFNPYKAYLNDMMHCLSGIPAETFIYEPRITKESEQVVPTDEPQNSTNPNDVDDAETAKLNNASTVNDTGSDESISRKNEARGSDKQTAPNADTQSEQKFTQVLKKKNHEAPELANISNQCDTKLTTRYLQSDKPDVCRGSESQQGKLVLKPHLRWLTGIRPCLLAK